jgi:hypothetical protein
MGDSSVRAASHAFGPIVLAVTLMALALPPRLLATDRFVTTDELFWVGRAAAFGRGVETGRLGQTIQTGHPGVTTMWTAWLGMGPALARDLAPSRKDVSRREVTQSPSFMPALSAARRAFGVVTAVGIGLLGLLAWRLFGPWPALLGGALLALDPFFLAHSRLVHIDASLTLWISLAIVAGIYRSQGGGRWSLILCAVSTGLGLLSKSPALILVVLVPLSLVPYRQVVDAAARRRPDLRELWPALREIVIWGIVAGATVFVVWPALWTAPLDTVSRFLAFIRDNANPDHAAAADDEGAGLLFYPLVLVYRLTPLTWLGLLGLLLPPWRYPGGRTVPMLLLFALAFGTAMTVAAKGFDRYLLPIFPAVDLLAGLGLWRIVCLAADSLPSMARLPHPRTVFGMVALAGSVGASVYFVSGAWPYELTYANPLLGGNPAAQATIASGWGEGLDEAARYLNDRTGGSRLKVGMPGEIYTTVLDAQLNGTVAPAEGYDAGAYDAFVVYRRNTQLGERPPFFDEELLSWTPDQTVTLSGVPYAWVYTTRAGAPVGAVFGDLLALDGYGLDTATPKIGRRFELRLRWRALQPLPKGLGVVVELRPVSGDRPTVQTLPMEPSGEASAWPTQERMSVAYQLPLDPGLAAGDYVVAVSVVGADGNELPVTTQPRRPPGVPSEPTAVPLRRIQPR